MGIFDKRVEFKPFEYPAASKFKDAINHSYWLVSEWNFVSDVQDFHTKLTPSEQNTVKNALLGISQIEVSVKKFWAKLGDRFPKPEIDQVGLTFGESECFDDQTEILTSSGWKLFQDLLVEDLVAQYHIDSKNIEFVHYSNAIKRPYSGLMHLYSSNGTDLCITPNHEVIVQHPQKDVAEKRMSCEGIWARNYRYPCAGYGISQNPIEFTTLDKLLIAIQADGCLFGNCPTGHGRRDFTFSLAKKRKIDRLQAICNELNIPLTIRKNSKGQTVLNGFLPDTAPEVSLIKEFGYINLTHIDSRYAQAFINEVKYWDASTKESSYTYYNSNEKAIDTVQIIGTLGGYSTNKGINRTAEKLIEILTPDKVTRKSSKTVYALNICFADKKIYPKRKEIEYHGMVYCVTVPSGCIVTRRNKRVVISGNCRHADAYSHLLQVLHLNTDFKALLEIPCMKGRVEYLSKYINNSPQKTQQEYLLTLTLFSIFVENISLFSQFLIIKSFNKHKNVLKDIDNVINATRVEETVHGLFGFWLINEVKKEHPEWFTQEFYDTIVAASHKAYEAEANIIEWIFEAGDLDFITRAEAKEFIKQRFNESLETIGAKPIFDVDQTLVEKLMWFNEEMWAEVNTDFFYKKPTTYSKKMQSVGEGDLF